MAHTFTCLCNRTIAYSVPSYFYLTWKFYLPNLTDLGDFLFLSVNIELPFLVNSYLVSEDWVPERVPGVWMGEPISHCLEATVTFSFHLRGYLETGSLTKEKAMIIDS